MEIYRRTLRPRRLRKDTRASRHRRRSGNDPARMGRESGRGPQDRRTADKRRRVDAKRRQKGKTYRIIGIPAGGNAVSAAGLPRMRMVIMSTTETNTIVQELWALLGEITDPEVTVLSIVD